MAQDYFHGIQVAPQSDAMFSTPAPLYTPIGLVAVADDANADRFPLEKAVLLKSYGADVQAQTGSGGTLKNVLDTINSLGFFPPMVIVRVASGADDAAQAVEVQKGLELLKTASAALDIEPKIVGAPGLDADSNVVNGLGPVLESLEAYGYVALSASSDVEAKTAAAGITDKRIMTIWPDFLYEDNPVSAVALALGLRSMIDATIGPHKTLSNVAIPSSAIDAVSVLVDWKTADSMGNELNADNITTLIRRNGEFYFWGNRGRAGDADVDWVFESTVRMSDVLNGIVKANQFDSVDYPMSRAMIEDRLEAINSDIDSLVKKGWLIAGKAWIDPGQNSVEILKNGGLWIDYDFQEPKPLEHLGLNATVTNRYILQVLPDWVNTDELATTEGAV